MNTVTRFLALLALTTTAIAAHADIDGDIRYLQSRWAEVNYQLEGKTRLTAFAQLSTAADKVTATYPDRAEGWIWSGIIKSTHAGAKGGLGALALAKSAKKDLETALGIDPDALQGSAYTSLGTLYASVPGWPVGFGDSLKAEQLLKQALAANPDGIDSNYFYGDYLLKEKRYNDAKVFFLKAQQAAPRPGRELADAGRHEEIAAALAQIARQLN